MALARGGTMRVVVGNDKYCANAEEMADNGQVCQAHDQGVWFPIQFNSCPFCGKHLSILPPNQHVSDLLKELPSFGAGAIFKRKVAAATAGLKAEVKSLTRAFILILAMLIVVVVGLVHLVLKQPSNTGYSTSGTPPVSMTQGQINDMVARSFNANMEPYLPALDQIKKLIHGDDEEEQEEQTPPSAPQTNGEKIKKPVGGNHQTLPVIQLPRRPLFDHKHEPRPGKPKRPRAPSTSSGDDSGLY